MNKIHQMEVTMDKAEASAYKAKRGVRRIVRHWKAKVLAVLLGVSLSFIMIFVAFYNTVMWFKVNDINFYNPVILRPPVVIEARKQQLATPSAIVEIKPTTDPNLAIINELYRKVRFMESNAGMSKNDTGTHAYCQTIGQVNEIGYLVDGDKHFCFSDYGEQFLTFKRWFEKRLPTMSTVEALCLWNTGTKQPNCMYYQKYMSL